MGGREVFNCGGFSPSWADARFLWSEYGSIDPHYKCPSIYNTFMKIPLHLISLMTLAVALPAFAAPPVLVEAESFETHGGWKNDQQFMDQMGSPFLLAHGIGIPVADAVTSVDVPTAGQYRVWVRTRDWVAPWKTPETSAAKRAYGTPGIFKLLVNGTELETSFGNEGAEWHWQDGGLVDLDSGSVELKLHDLTGFAGRCDAILLSPDLEALPDDAAPAAWRRDLLGISETPVPAGEYDLVVVGGGIAGTAAAISAARLGCTVALIQDRPVLGGNASSEICVNVHGKLGYKPYQNIGNVVRELSPENEKHWHKGPFETGLPLDEMRETLVRSVPNLSLFLNHRANDVVMNGKRIVSVVAQNIRSGQSYSFQGKWFADCTGDGSVGFLSGADYAITTNGHMGRSNLWFVSDTGVATEFPNLPWALDLTEHRVPDPSQKISGWYWESGYEHDPFAKGEYIRDWNFRAAYGTWDKVKNVEKRYATHAIKWMAYISGKRESRRLMGDYILNRTDLALSVKYDDGCVPLSWSMDTHHPDSRYVKGFEGDAFIAQCHQPKFPTPYWMPFRCLYSRDVPNLFMAGRNVSATRPALGSVRLQRTTGMMGEIVGMAASLCKEHNVDPRGVYKKHMPDLKALMVEGTGKKPEKYEGPVGDSH